MIKILKYILTSKAIPRPIPEPPPVTKAISPFNDFGQATNSLIDSKTEIERNPARRKVNSGTNKPRRTKFTMTAADSQLQQPCIVNTSLL